MHSNDFLKQLSQEILQNHRAQKNILSLDQFLEEVIQSPQTHIRNANVYILDALAWIQTTMDNKTPGDFFEQPIRELFHTQEDTQVFGQSEVIHQLIQSIDAAFREDVPQRLLLLHGPNGSGKTSIIKKLMSVLEAYSTTDEGALYSFNWIFPTKEIVGKRLGITSPKDTPTDPEMSSYAFLPPETIQCLIRSEIREPPFFLLPTQYRVTLWKTLEKKSKTNTRFSFLKKHFTEGILSVRNKNVLEALLKSYDGDILKVYRHVQVERFYLNRNSLSGLVTINPSTPVDVGLRQISVEKSYQQLPATLQSINLYELQGELVAGNRGLVEFDDLLKRPLESFKYLLGTCETGQVQVGPVMLQIDSVLVGSCNEQQMEAFKAFPDFPSFKARFDLIQTPFLLNYLEEAKIYQPLVQQLSVNKPFTPKTAEWMALWAIMTRLKKPHSQGVSDSFKNDVSQLSCLHKAYLYAQQYDQIPFHTPDIEKIDQVRRVLREQYCYVPMYEGRIGASPRELKNLLLCAFKREGTAKSVTFQHLQAELEELTQRGSEFEFLRQEVVDGYHNPPEYITQIKNLAMNHADEAFRTALGMYDSDKMDAYLNKYLYQISHVLKKEKIRNPETNKMEDPDLAFIEGFEKRAEVRYPDAFREKIMNTVASAYLQEPQQKTDFKRLFPQLKNTIITAFYSEKKLEILSSIRYLLKHPGHGLPESGQRRADQAKEAMTKEFGYQHECLQEALGWLLEQWSQ